MRIRLLLLMSLFILWAIAIPGQRDIFWDDNGKLLDENRYMGYEGSPYIFEDFVLSDIVGFSGTVHEDIPINYNAHLQQFELKRQDKLFLLHRDYYLIITVLREKNPALAGWGDTERIVFKRGFHPDFLEHFVQLEFDGSQVKLVRDPRKAIDEKVFQDVGKKVEIKRFNSRDRLYLIIQGESHEIELNEKDILKAIGHKNLVKNFRGENKIDLERMEELKVLLQYLDDHLQ